jgi:hypothetical protein
MANRVIGGNDADVALSPVGVEGNARLTGATGAALFVLLAAEGITILRIHDLITAHVFVGTAIAAFAVTKLGSVGYRFVRYYVGDPGYVRKGAPHPVLRVDGPIVVVTTIAVVGTGLAGLAAGRSARWLMDLHKASFILWFVAMTVHVVGHVLDTPALAIADYRTTPGARPVSGTWLRRLATVATLVTGIVLGVVVINSGWMSTWTHVVGR